MNDTLRLVFLAVLGFSMLMLYKNWQEWEQRITADDTSAAAISAEIAGNQPPVSAAGDADLPAPTQTLQSASAIDSEDKTLPAATAISARLIRVETDWIEAAISEDGGNLVELNLKKHLLNGAPFPLLEDEQRRYIAQNGVIGVDGAPNHNNAYAVVARTDGEEATTLDLQAKSGGVILTKRYIFQRTGYLLSIVLIAENTGAEELPLQGYYQIAHDGKSPRNYSSLLPTFFGAAAYTESEKFVKVALDDIGEDPYPRKSDDGWIGIIQRYFAALWLPPAGVEREFFMSRAADGGARVGVILPFGVVGGGETKTVSARLFAGAEEQNILNELNENGDAPGIHLIVDYGWLTFIAVLLFKMLAAIDSVVGNWGMSIILLTVLVKLLFYPLSSAAYRSMARIKNEAPRIKQMQEKYSNDRQRLQKEMMALYREKKINPLGGCLPILVQIPVFIALYWVLLGSVELRQAPFVLWLTDLSTPDPYFILSLIMGGAMYLQTRLSPAPPDPTQAMIMRIMPIGFSLFSVFFPSGLVLYWAVNTLLSIAQQWHITRRLAKIASANK